MAAAHKQGKTGKQRKALQLTLPGDICEQMLPSQLLCTVDLRKDKGVKFH
jgi:hypothetical protein